MLCKEVDEVHVFREHILAQGMYLENTF
jgi:hypothetical protein